MRKLSLLVAVVLAGCALFEPQSKVKSGALFTTGQAEYDDYFNKVHQLQVESSGYDDDRKSDRRGLIDALKIATDSVDVTILEATHQRMVGIAHTVGPTRVDLREDEGKITLASEARADVTTRDFIKALQTTLDGEEKRKHALRDVPQRCDDLAKLGHGLEPRIRTDFFKQGGTMMADVHDELAASLEVLDQISKNARLARREAEDFIAELGRSVASDSGETVVHTENVASTRPPATTQPPPTATAAAHTSAPVVAQTPKPKPKPKPKPSGGGDEDFNP